MKPHVYLTSLHLKHGGCEKAISLLANSLVKRGYPVSILCTYRFGEPAYKLDEKVEVRYLTDRLPNREEFRQAVKSGRFLKAFGEGVKAVKTLRERKEKLREALAGLQEGIVVASRDLDAQLLSDTRNDKLVKIAQVHYDPLTDKDLVEHLKSDYRSIDAVVLLQESYIEQLEQAGVPAALTHRMRCIPNFLSDEYVAHATQTLSLSQRGTDVIAVGRFEPEKGFDRLIDAWKIVAPRFPAWKLHLVGSGSMEQELRQRCISWGIADQVIFEGLLDTESLSRLYARCAILAHPARSEAFGLVLAEAAAHGLPLVAFDIAGGPQTFVDKGVNGFFAQDEEEFAHSLMSLMEDPERAACMGKASRQKALCYTESAVVARWISLFEEVSCTRRESRES